MVTNNRDDFSTATIRTLASRVGYRCSFPGCRRLTCGPNSNPDKYINLGVAAHIYAAAPGGPRYNPEMTSEQRKSPNNGIWLCQTHSVLIDKDSDAFPADTLLLWKKLTEDEARRELYGQDNFYMVFPNQTMPSAPSEISQDTSKVAQEWYNKATALFDAGEYYDALYYYRRAYDEQHFQAANMIGYIYEIGECSLQNDQEAAKWFRISAEKEYSVAQFNLGTCYSNGWGVDADYFEAFYWYCKAAEQELSEAQFSVGNCYYNSRGVDMDKSKAVDWYKRAAKQGHARAQFNIGYCYDMGLGVDVDKVEAINWYRIAAAQNILKAYINLGNCYYNGSGVVVDRFEAFNWYQKAAEQGFAEGQFNLGNCYYNGEGVDVDYFEAFSWYSKALSKNFQKPSLTSVFVFTRAMARRQTTFRQPHITIAPLNMEMQLPSTTSLYAIVTVWA